METCYPPLSQQNSSSPRASVGRRLVEDEHGEQTNLSKSNSSNINGNRNGWWVAETSSTYSPSGASPSSSSSSASSLSSTDDNQRRTLIPSPSSGSLPYDEQEYHKRNGVLAWGRRQDAAFDDSVCSSPIAALTVANHGTPVSDRATKIYAGPRRRIGRPPLAATTLSTIDTTLSLGSIGGNIATPASPLKRHRAPVQQHFHHHHQQHHNHHQHHQRHVETELPSAMLVQQRRRRLRRNPLSTLPSPQNNSSPRRTAMAAFSESASNSNTLPPPPPLKMIAWELSCVCLYYMRYGIHTLRNAFQTYRTPIQRVSKILAYIAVGGSSLVILLLMWLLMSFWLDASKICTPPPGYSQDGQRPLVEYYVHGRGIGHYARSVAIVNQLNEAGVDVRLFLSRSSHWRALHEDRQQQQLQQQTVTLLTKTEDSPAATSSLFPGLGTTSAFAVTSLSPALSFFGALSHTLERIMGDCEVARRSSRYPVLIVTDADLPGMLRAKLGGIPSVGIAHGQLFHIAQKPAWIAADKRLSKSWDRQGRLNFYSSWFSSWQIATHFCFLETKVATGVVARAPLRAEIQSMAQFRKRASRRVRRKSRGGDHPTVNLFRTSNSNATIPQEDRIRKLLWFGSEYANETATPKTKSRRKVVISYFRDHNGQRIQRALLQAGFDVLNFDNGYSKEEYRDPNRYGAKWIVDPNEDVQRRRHRLRIFGSAFTKAKSTKKLQRHDRQKLDGPQAAPHQNQSRRRRLTTASTAADAKAIMDELSSFSAAPRLIRVMDRSMFVPLMHVADGVVSSAGSQLMSECIYAGMPLLALYLERDDEQRLNVELSHHGESTCAHPHQIVFGSSLEDLMQSGALLLASPNATAASAPASTAMAPFGLRGLRRQESSFEDARREFVKFLESVRASPISQDYYDELEDEPRRLREQQQPLPSIQSTNETTTTLTDANTTVSGATNQSVTLAKEQDTTDHSNEKGEDDDEDDQDDAATAKANMLIAKKGMMAGVNKILPQSEFQGLPDAAAIILEIIKQQIQQQQRVQPTAVS